MYVLEFNMIGGQKRGNARSTVLAFAGLNAPREPLTAWPHLARVTQQCRSCDYPSPCRISARVRLPRRHLLLVAVRAKAMATVNSCTTSPCLRVLLLPSKINVFL